MPGIKPRWAKREVNVLLSTIALDLRAEFPVTYIHTNVFTWTFKKVITLIKTNKQRHSYFRHISNGNYLQLSIDK